MIRVASCTSTTQGMPNSRATVAAWLSIPPVSTTTAAAGMNSGVQGVSVNGATSTSPGSMSRENAASVLRMIRARPVASPALTPMPVSAVVSTTLALFVGAMVPIHASGRVYSAACARWRLRRAMAVASETGWPFTISATSW